MRLNSKIQLALFFTPQVIVKCVRQKSSTRFALICIPVVNVSEIPMSFLIAVELRRFLFRFCFSAFRSCAIVDRFGSCKESKISTKKQRLLIIIVKHQIRCILRTRPLLDGRALALFSMLCSNIISSFDF